MKGLSKKIKNFQCNGLVVGNQGPLMKNFIFFFETFPFRVSVCNFKFNQYSSHSDKILQSEDE